MAMPEERRNPGTTPLQKVYDQLVGSASRTFQFLKGNTERTREQVQELFQHTAEQVSAKTGEARRVVQIRMAVLEIEHHLGRLYPQIGSQLCDQVEKDSLAGLNKDLQSKLDLAAEYRQRLVQLRTKLEAGEETAEAPKEDS